MRALGIVLAFGVASASCKGVVVSAFPEQFVGVGVELTIRDNIPTVVRTIDGGSAAEAGVKADDRILRINDLPTEGMTLPDVVLHLRGEPGSTVNVTLLRNGESLAAALVRHDVEKRGDGYVARKH